MDEPPAYAASPALEQPEAACDRCGRLGAVKVCDEMICDDCYIASGSCCAGDERASSSTLTKVMP
jgi:hypothetical protein